MDFNRISYLAVNEKMGLLTAFILWAALLQGFFLALIYILSKRNKSVANTLLGLFLMAIVLEALTTILPFDQIGRYVLNEYFALPEVKLFMPLFFLHFVLEKLGSSHRFAQFLKVNYTIAVFIASISLYNLYLFFSKSSSIARTFDFAFIDTVHFVLQLYAFLISIVAFVIAFREVNWYKKLVQNEYSDYNMLQIKWLWRFIYLLLPAVFLWAAELVRVIVAPENKSVFVLPLFGFIALFLYYISYQAYIHPTFFKKLPESVLDKKQNRKGTVEVENNCSAETSKLIQQCMKENEYYLDHDLTINLFARHIKMSPRLISTCINQNLGQNFNEWVNGFRVEKAKKLIENDAGNKLSIEGIGQESGFKSRSALYTAFKNKLGCSPGQYRQK